MTIGAKPKIYDNILARSEEVIRLFENKPITNTTQTPSEGVYAAAFRHFLLYLKVDSTGAPTTLRVKVQFLDEVSGEWHTYKQGLFASLYYEDTDVASSVNECFSGLVLGRQIRITLTGVGTTTLAYFTVSASLEFLN